MSPRVGGDSGRRLAIESLLYLAQFLSIKLAALTVAITSNSQLLVIGETW
jgi:hypothetical protein